MRLWVDLPTMFWTGQDMDLRHCLKQYTSHVETGSCGRERLRQQTFTVEPLPARDGARFQLLGEDQLLDGDWVEMCLSVDGRYLKYSGGLLHARHNEGMFSSAR